MPNSSTLLLYSALGLLAAVLLGAALYGNWVLREHRLTVITPGRVYQSAVMPPEALIQVAKYLGIQTVVDFRAYSEAPASNEEQAALEREGIRYLRLPSSTSPPPETVAAFVRALQPEVAAGHRLLMHCLDGEGRAVFYSAIYRIEFEGWDNERAYRSTTRLPPSLMFLRRAFPALARLSADNYKTPLIRAYRRAEPLAAEPLAPP
jgi:protein-tyrosine phosphatase